ncbi:Rubisco activation protein CbbO [Enterovibrio makurazakiensis]|uniref:nitric oxide reductase activation protein NorD n=1 Tax=Enterovibrio makurazakiensis TaxID=2910232 RepID=UPI003D1FF1EE
MDDGTPLSIQDIKLVVERHNGANSNSESDDIHFEDIEVALSDAQHLLQSDELASFYQAIRSFMSNKRFDPITVAWILTIPYLSFASGLKDIPFEGDVCIAEKTSHTKSDSVTRKIYSTTMELGRWVSSARQAQFLYSLPKVATQLNSSKEFLAYLQLIELLVLKAPRNLKSVLDNASLYLQALPFSGFRYWVLFGANAHAHQYEALDAYFSLASTESLTVFQKQRKGTLFSNVQRQVHFFLRAVWGSDFFMRPISMHKSLFANGDTTDVSPMNDTHSKIATSPIMTTQLATIEDGVILLPDAVDAIATLNTRNAAETAQSHSTQATLNKQLYRAMSAHCAAHVKYSRPRLRDAFSPLERICIGLFEDARVEAMAIEVFPGLKILWKCFHHPCHRHHQNNNTSAESYLVVLKDIANALLDKDASIEADNTRHQLVTASHTKFWNTLSHDDKHDSSQEIERLGCWLAHEVIQEFDISASIPSSHMEPLAPYRDDNIAMWCDSEAELVRWEVQQHQQVRRSVTVTQMVNEIDCELADENAQEIWTLHSEFFRDGDPENVSMNERDANALAGNENISPPILYPEWDYGLQAHRPDWVTLTERRAPLGLSEDIDSILAKRQMLVRKIKTLVETLQPKGLTRLRKQYDGDGLDLDAAIDAMKELRRGALPEMNIDQRLKRQERDIAVLVLLDLSQSTLDTIPNDDESRTILDVAKEATVMLASALDGIGDTFAIHGFSSNGREDVQYQRFKDFDEAYDDKAKSRLAGIQGGLSTRMGAALRHAKTFLAKQPQRKKLLLLVGDGEPADVDVRDPLYLQADTRRAVDELCSQGVIPYCLTIDPDADNYVGQIFGQGHYTVVDKVTQLPDVLPSLFASLTKRAG